MSWTPKTLVSLIATYIATGIMNVLNDPYVTCPYDKAHQVPKSRIQGHLIKCQNRYPKLSICPYNATHRMHYEELLKHVKDCPSKFAVQSTDSYMKQKMNKDIQVPIPETHCDNIQENGDDDNEWD